MNDFMIAVHVKRHDPTNLSDLRLEESSSRRLSRQSEEVRLQERARNRSARQAARSNEDVKRSEQSSNTQRKKAARECSTVDELVTHFKHSISTGPVFICSSCDQLLYKHSVQKACNLRSGSLSVVHSVLLGTISSDGNEYVCHTCNKHLRQNKIPPCSLANHLHFPAVPPDLPTLNVAEWRMISPRLAFMQIHEAAVGRQLRIHGNVVCVPADVCTTVNMLPRTSSNMETIAVKLKKKSQYQHSFLTANIRPACIRQVGSYLVQHGELFKKENISFNTSSLDSLQDSDDFIVADELQVDEVTTGSSTAATTAETSQPLASELSSSATVDDSDSWNELDDTEVERAGVFDTMFTSPDFVEADERQTIYRRIDSGQCDKVYSFSPAEHNKPISVFLDQHSEELSFPNIFWGAARSESHPTKIHYSEIVKSELRRRDRRAASCVDNIFYKVKRQQMQAVLGKVNIAVRKRKTGGSVLTARNFKTTSNAIDELIKFDDGYRILKEIRGSPPYWEKARKDLYAMIRQLGPAHLFLTLSAAETRWVHLLKMLSIVVDNVTLTDDEVSHLSWSTKCRLISSDPVTCARHFDYSVHQFFNTFLKSSVSPFGHMSDFWYRVEFQHRGSPHVHCLLWISDVPVYGKDELIDVINYIDRILTCQRTWNESSVDSLVDFQVHKHTKTCKKQFRKRTVCRFDFPKLPMPSTVILDPLVGDEDTKKHAENFTQVKTVLSKFKPGQESMTFEQFLSNVNLDFDSYILAVRSSLKTSTVFLRRQPTEVRVNNYNLHCLKSWQANMDIQFILDVYACASYITSYIAKSQRGMSELLRNACTEARQGNVNLKQQVRIIGNKFLNNVEMSAQEAVYLALQLPLKRSSRQVIFVNTSAPEDRVYLLKPNVDQLPDDEDIAQSSLITRYVKRSSELENVCLADYAALYDKVTRSASHTNSDDEDDSENVALMSTSSNPVCRNVPKVIRYFHVNRVSDPENYARVKLMLYAPWRNEERDLSGAFQTCAERYEAHKSHLVAKIKTYETFADEVTAAQQSLAEDNQRDQWDLLAPGLLHSDDSAQAAGVRESELHAAVHPDLHGQTRDFDLAIDLGIGHVTSADTEVTRYSMAEDDYFTLMKSLNREQMEFVSDTIHHLKTSSQPVYRFLSGGAGTGKSHVLKALRETAERYFKSRSGADFQQHWSMTVAPTGKAAFLAGGATIHSVLHVPANQALTFHRLDHDSLNTLRTHIGHVKLWLIDEISMVGHRLFSFIDQRLQEVNNTNQPFGGASVITFGDFFQLAPVMDGFIFHDFSCTTSTVEDYNSLALNLWREHFTMFELTQIMRQQNCIPFAELLNRLREGSHTSDDIQTLESRIISPDVTDYPISVQHLFRTNAKVDEFNSHIYHNCALQKLVVTSVDSVIGSISDDMAHHVMTMIPQDTRKTMQLPQFLKLAVGCRYCICV